MRSWNNQKSSDHWVHQVDELDCRGSDIGANSDCRSACSPVMMSSPTKMPKDRQYSSLHRRLNCCTWQDCYHPPRKLSLIRWTLKILTQRHLDCRCSAPEFRHHHLHPDETCTSFQPLPMRTTKSLNKWANGEDAALSDPVVVAGAGKEVDPWDFRIP